MTPRIQKAIDIFLDALNEEKLMKGDCTACAVGNLCGRNSAWAYYFMTDANTGEQRGINPSQLNFYKKDADIVIEKTDFTINELKQIEFAFETNAKIHHIHYFEHSRETIRRDQINGLKAVIEVMMTFDDCKENVNEVFISKAELIPIH